MRQRRFFFPLLAVALATAPNLAPQSSHMQEKVGKLTKLTASEIDIDCFDQGQTVSILFMLAPGAKSPPASLGETVNVTFYLDEKGQKIAKSFTVYVKAPNPSAPGSGKNVEPSAVSESVPPSPQGISADTQQAAVSSTASSQQSASSAPQESASAGGSQEASTAASSSSASEQASEVAASENPPSVTSSSSSSGLDAWGVQKKILSEFSLTKTTADKSDIVTAGSVLVLHKDGLVMFSTPTTAPPTNIYKDGRLHRNEMADRFNVLGSRWKLGNTATADLNDIPHRTFVAGEKFWVTGVDIKPDGLILTVYSDPYDDIRYYGQIRFPYPKNSPPPASEMAKTVEEVVTAAKDDEDKAGTIASASAPAAAMQPLAPPPPPDQASPPTATIEVGQSKEEVVAAFGQPRRIVKLGNKEIYYYPDMKVTFVGGKVTDVQ